MPTVTYNWSNLVSGALLNTTIGGDQLLPTIAAINRGTYYLGAWDDGTGDVSAQFVRSSGNLNASNFTINAATSATQTDASIAQLVGDQFFTLGGVIVVTYTDYSADPGGDIRARFFLPGTTAIDPNASPGQAGADIDVNDSTENDFDSDVTALANGGFVVTYTRDLGGGNLDLHGTIFNQDGTVRVSLLTVASGTGTASSSAQVAGLAGGNFAVVWQQQDLSNGNSSVWYQLYAPNGSTVGGATAIDTGGSINRDIQIAALQDGGFAVAYSDNGWAGGDGTEITLKIYNADGSGRTDNLLVNTGRSGNQVNPTLTTLSNGTLVVGWTSAGNAYYQAYTPTGGTILGNYLAATNANSLEIAGLTGSSIASIIESTISDGSGTAIRSNLDELVRTTVGNNSGEVLVGDALRDIIIGGSGNDIIIGGAGVDVLTGGLGADTFRGTFAELIGDTITDFTPSDRIHITDRSPVGFNANFGNLNGRVVVNTAGDGGLDVQLLRGLDDTKNDFNGDGRADFLWRNVNGDVIEWLGQAGGRFANNPTATYLLDTGYNIAGTGDYNGDGISDVLWRSSFNGDVFEWLGQSNGVFVNNLSAVYQLSIEYQVAANGDFNGDGRSDVLWRSSVTGNVIQWLGQTNGTFANNAAAAFQMGTDWTLLSAQDANGDTRSDLIWRNEQGQVVQWLGQANGTFVANASATYTLGLNWTLVGNGDYNGDGRDDIIWRDQAGGSVITWLAQADGSFANNPGAAFSLPSEWRVDGTDDYNGDTRDDLVWRNDDTGAIIQWLGQPGGGFANNEGVVYLLDLGWRAQPSDVF